MTSCRPPSFSTFSWRLIAFIFLPSSSSRRQILHDSFRMTINVSCHSEWTQECCVKKKGKRDGDTEWRIYYFDDALPLSLITVTDPSHSFRMTINISLIMTPYRSPHHDTLSFNRHSEWRQECSVRKQESGNMTRSEESMTRMTSLTDSSGHLCPTPFQIYACK